MLFGLDMQTLLLIINLITLLDFSKILIGKFLFFGCILYIGTVFFFLSILHPTLGGVYYARLSVIHETIWYYMF